MSGNVFSHATFPPKATDAAMGFLRRALDDAARATVWILNQAEVPRERWPVVPIKYLMRLAAILTIGKWQATPEFSAIGNRFPKFSMLLGELPSWAKQFESTGNTPKEIADPSLESQITRIWLESFAWDATDRLGAEVLVDDFEDQQIDFLVELLWKNRHLSVEATR